MYHQKSKFSLILAPFLLEAAEASQCYFFENRWKKLKFPNLLKPLGTLSKKYIDSSIPQGYLVSTSSLYFLLWKLFKGGNYSQKYGIKSFVLKLMQVHTVKINALISSWQHRYSNSKAPGCTVNNSLPKAMEVGGNHLGLTPLHTVGFL